MDILTKHNRNDDQNSPGGLRSEMRRFVKFNGAVSADQLAWLDGVLQDSDMNREVVLVAGEFLRVCTDLSLLNTKIVRN